MQGVLILDPFCGCGTSIIASEQLGRRWCGIDIGERAIGVLKEKRIPKEAPGATFNEQIEPFDLESARLLAQIPNEDGRYPFQWWAVRKLGGRYEKKKGSDRGIDGDMAIEGFDDEKRQRRVIISVKSGDNQTVGWVTELHGAVANPVHKAHMGILITLDPPKKGLVERAREYGIVPATSEGATDPYKIQIISAADLFTPGFGALQLPGRNVTKRTAPLFQTSLPIDANPVRNKAVVRAGRPKKSSGAPEATYAKKAAEADLAAMRARREADARQGADAPREEPRRAVADSQRPSRPPSRPPSQTTIPGTGGVFRLSPVKPRGRK